MVATELKERQPYLLLPVLRSGGGAKPAFLIRDHGGRALLQAYTALDRLVDARGPMQPWALIPRENLVRIRREQPFDALEYDAGVSANDEAGELFGLVTHASRAIPPVLYVPVLGAADDGWEWAAIAMRADGARVLFAYTSLDRLVEQCGPRQRWSPVLTERLPLIATRQVFHHIAVDRPLPPGIEAAATAEGR